MEGTMSVFAVKVETIGAVRAHPNADRLDIGTINGMSFQFCIGRGQYQTGDTVVYFPVDSVLPDDLIKKLDIRNMLAGSNRSRVRTVNLRGQVSQGLVVRADAIFPDGAPPVGTDITSLLGVTKYDPPEPITYGGVLIPMPDGLGVYDIEGADRFPQVVDALMDMPCYITEKLEGSNAAMVRTPSGEITVCQRNYAIQLDGSGNPNTFVNTFKTDALLSIAEAVAKIYPNGTIALRGELLGPGIQGNIYGLSKHEIRLFDIKVGNRYLDAAEFIEFVGDENLRVPTLRFNATLRDWLNGNSVQDASNGYSHLNTWVRREGVVIKPTTECTFDFGTGYRSRLIIKQRSPAYLANEK